MTSDSTEEPIPAPAPFARPRPGVLKTLGILNIVFAILSMMCIGWSYMMFYAFSAGAPAKIEVKVDAKAPGAKTGGTPMIGAFNPFVGMSDPKFIAFGYVENGVSLLINGLMFATGIALINLRRWGAVWWSRLAWLRIVTVFFLWGYYIVAVAPGFSESMAKEVAAQFAAQGLPPNRIPPVADLTRIYSIMNLIIALGAIVVASIYPAISIWLLSRPGVKAAIVDKNPATLEPKLT